MFQIYSANFNRFPYFKCKLFIAKLIISDEEFILGWRKAFMNLELASNFSFFLSVESGPRIAMEAAWLFLNMRTFYSQLPSVCFTHDDL